jgi:multidrug efflux pump subunit AcrB
LEQITLMADQEGRLIRIGDIAEVERRPQSNQLELTYRGEPTVELQLMRSATADSLESARVMQDWLEEARARLPPDVEVTAFDESWSLIQDRINLLLKNGLGGLILVVLILFLFLNGRVAFWVTVGIPVSFMATLAIVYVAGGSINMISLFALIMALGIIVDDAIVVGEDALAHYQSGEASLEAAEGGARRMLAPVVSSSLTTIAAFLPLMLVGGVIGNILSAIPLVIVAVIVASLVECFLVLPGHLRHAFRHLHHREPGRLRQRLDGAFAHFRDRHFRRLVTLAVDYRGTTVAAALALMLLAMGLLAGGRIGFTFFPNVEGNVVIANAAFVAGTPEDRVQGFLAEVEEALWETDRELGGGLVVTAHIRHATQISSSDRPGQKGDQFGAVMAELIPSDSRTVRNEDFIRHWRAKVSEPAGMENFTIVSRRGGHPGRSINVRLVGGTPERLKQAATRVQEALATMDGVSGVEYDMPWGQAQLIYHLTPEGHALGLTVESVGRQLRAAFDGHIAQIFHQGNDEVEVRVTLPDAERDHADTLAYLPVLLPDGNTAPLPTVVGLEYRRSFEVLRHAEAERAAHVYADVDRRVANENDIRQALESGVLAELESRWGITSSFEGKAADQRETMADMGQGLVMALALIYLVLAWVFASYGWPLVIMAAIPFALVGAVTGHFVMGLDLTILSLFGLFGLSGIVVNDSIILITFYKHLREQGLAVREAIIEAACRRLRAVLLTSLTTIAGLTPLLFETSMQAQFLIPMAVSISFGLGFATVLVLFFIPALLSLHESAADRLQGRRGPLAEGASA